MWDAPAGAAFVIKGPFPAQDNSRTAGLSRALCRQAAQDLGERVQATEIAFFGGSFTAIEKTYMYELLQAAKDCAAEYGFAGIRASTRPDAVDEAVVECLLSYGVTALELGAQSMDDGVLLQNNRGHTVQDVKKAAKLVKDAGISLGVQMMTGLYGSTPHKEQDTAEQLAALGPDTVRIYPTVVLQGTALAELVKRGVYNAPGVEESVDLCAKLMDFFEQAGVRVIRVGLHASKEVEQQAVAGAYHPAFRELCEAKRFLSRILLQLQNRPKEREYEVYVHPSCISKAVGQRKTNLEVLAKQGYHVRIRQGEEVPYGTVQIREKGGVAGCI